MSDPAMPAARARRSLLKTDPGTSRRNAAERRFRAYGAAAVVVAMAALAALMFTVFRDGASAFVQARATIPVVIAADVVDPDGNRDPAEMAGVLTMSYGRLLDQALTREIERRNIQVEGLTQRDITGFLSAQARADLRRAVLADPALVGQEIEWRMMTSSRVDGMLKGRVTRDTAARDAKTSVAQYDLAMALRDQGVVRAGFNWRFITAPDGSDSRPESAGLGVAILGSLYMMLIVLVLALPIGVAASIWLEEFAPKNRLTDVIEVNISNLAAVPSIVFGILGLAAFINFVGLPRSAPIVGGLVLTLMTLPTIIIATRAALKAVPPSIRDAALGVGASRMQTVFHHVLPLAMPGILTGTILGLAQALGETAPLMLIGMVAFVSTYPSAPPQGLLDPASALPVQIYNWTQRADPAFFERASGAIIVLLAFLLAMNLIAIWLRRKFERRW
ncbi:phosphate ABC transporter permease PstA [Paracoccus alkenifer]|uniref:Phosphate transport system permease protein PstA n=1 Tax=Paracoccus alkenifer TaxID=65735 RepID=A0A1H6L165_9RHOB|nr:phosphate ABC transporter permease PstA [Paracoccus alkenifer]SEH81930.1 phosphate ABC transporter membrane protein 2, PhoT family (TC 3.A.1.7.1) [Paracoccus alkenifer]